MTHDIVPSFRTPKTNGLRCIRLGFFLTRVKYGVVILCVQFCVFFGVNVNVEIQHEKVCRVRRGYFGHFRYLVKLKGENNFYSIK
jgi:hypothetical protein